MPSCQYRVAELEVCKGLNHNLLSLWVEGLSMINLVRVEIGDQVVYSIIYSSS